MTSPRERPSSVPLVRTAVIPAAGRGTRLGRLTQAIPKELLPLGDRPTLDVVLDELVDAGIDRVVIVTRPDKTVLNDYVTDVLQGEFRARGVVLALCPQDAGPGNGGAILSAAGRLPAEPFIVLWGDEVVFGANRTRAVLERHRQTGRPTIAVVRAPRSALRRCGVARIAPDGSVRELVEKPSDPPADGLASVGGYVVTAEVLDALRATPPAADGEVYLSAALADVARAGGVQTSVVHGDWHETGSPAGYAGAFAAAVRVSIDIQHVQ